MRRTLSVLTLGFLLGGLLMMAARPGGAAAGDHLVLGTKNRSVTMTKLVTKRGLHLVSRRAGRPPLYLYAQTGTPPLYVNSNTVVNQLNADFVDGWSAHELRSVSAWCSNDNIADGASFECYGQIQVPAGGATVFMTGSVGMVGHPTNTSTPSCSFWYDGGGGKTPVSASVRAVTVEPNDWVTCSTDAVRELPAGYYSVGFTFTNPGDVDPDQGVAWFVMLPN